MTLTIAALVVHSDIFGKGSRPAALPILEDAMRRADIVVGPEYLLGVHDQSTKNDLVDRIQTLAKPEQLVIPGSTLLEDDEVVFNSAPIIGEVSKPSHTKKKFSDEENWYASSKEKRMTYNNDRSLFDWQGIQVGLEICLEHNYGVLKREARKQPDIHILISCGHWVYTRSVCLKEGGVFIYSDGRDKTARVGKMVDGKMQRVRATKRLKHYRLYKVSLN